MAINTTYQIPLALANNDTKICLTGQSLDASTISSVPGVGNKTTWQKLHELSKVPSERAKMRPNLLKICDKIMIKKIRIQQQFFREVDVNFFLESGEAFYKLNIRRDLNATGALMMKVSGTKNGILAWPFAGRLGL